MFCDYCGEIIKQGVTQCPCCGARVTTTSHIDEIDSIPSANTMDYSDLPKPTTGTNYNNDISNQSAGASNITATSIVMTVISFIMPLVGIIFGVKFLKSGNKVFGVICLVAGIFQSLSFFLPFLFVFFADFMDILINSQ